MGSWIVRWAWLCLLLAGLGCTSSGGPGAAPSYGPGAFGARCQKTEDCSSGLCVRVDDAGGICSRSCTADSSCPAADNWACLTNATGLSVCACRKLADTELCANGIDDDCDGQVDDCRVCAGKAVPNDDPENCGACGTACSASQVCRNGACACPDAAPDACGQSCTDLKTDGQNCGACGTVCGSDRACQAGACTCTDSAHGDYCAGAGCVSLANDSAHCGTCDATCGLGQTCQSGACACPSTNAPDFCSGVGCVNFSSDSQNCGSCGNACPNGQVCSAGACGCPSGQTLCGQQCVDVQTDTDNCGACGSACGPVQACSGGSCGCESFGFKVCGGTCANLQTDPSHCGTCDTACATNERCSSGACVCDSGLHCGGSCVTKSDASNCGGCGTVCGAAQVCANSSCICQGFGLTACGSQCLNVQTDPANCGACGRVCPTGETCNNGSCGCSTLGQTYCAAAQLCTTLSTDASHCGACGTTCSPTQICANSACTCGTYGQLYCAAAQKCIDTLSDAKNCGACGKVCNATQVCSGGTCTCPSFNQTFCAAANACETLATDSANCGACGKVCPAGTHCGGSQCLCDQAGQTLCGTTCHDLKTEKANCGVCGNACSGNFSCLSSQCQCQNATPGTAVRVTNDTVEDYAPVSATDGTHVGVVYLRNDPALGNGFDNVRFALLAANGTLVSDIPLTTVKSDPVLGTNALLGPPSIAWSGTEYGIAWAQADTVVGEAMWFARVGANGALKAAAVDITPEDPRTNAYAKGAIAYSATDGGFAVSYLKDGLSSFRFIGTTGTVLGAEITSSTDFGGGESLAAAADGRWGSSSVNSSNFTTWIYDADGARTTPTSQFGGFFGRKDWVSMVYDGSSWISAWSPWNTDLAADRIMINRGSVANAPTTLFTQSDTTTYSDAVLAVVDGTLAVAFAQAPTSVAGRKLSLQRFAIPSTTSVFAPIDGMVDILSTYTINVGGTNPTTDFSLAAIGSGSLLAIWADNRWGQRELYAAPVDLHSCP